MEDIDNTLSENIDKPLKDYMKRGRKPGKRLSNDRIDSKSKLEKSRQSARECRARKKLRYQYLEELVSEREKAIFYLRNEIEKIYNCCLSYDNGQMNCDLQNFLYTSSLLKEEP